MSLLPTLHFVVTTEGVILVEAVEIRLLLTTQPALQPAASVNC